MVAWIKLFEDNTAESATEATLASGKSSWSRGRLTGIKEVQLSTKMTLASLSIPDTNWHQFDHYIVSLTDKAQESHCLLSVIQAEIKDSHISKYILKEQSSSFIFSVKLSDKKEQADMITSDMVGKYITIVLPAKSKPYVLITERGKFK